MQATVHRPGEGERIGGPTTVTIKATGEETNDSFYLGEVVIEPGFPGPPPHRHQRLHDMFYVLDGTLTMRLGDKTLELEPSGFVGVPPGVVHTFSNQSDAPVRFLNFNTPAGWENYMRDLAAVLGSGTPTQERSVGSHRDTTSRSSSAGHSPGMSLAGRAMRKCSPRGTRLLSWTMRRCPPAGDQLRRRSCSRRGAAPAAGAPAGPPRATSPLGPGPVVRKAWSRRVVSSSRAMG
jgi:quercetin dioxygenase-like cupin family protein